MHEKHLDYINDKNDAVREGRLDAQVIVSATSSVCCATYSWSSLFSHNSRQATEYLPVYAGPTWAKLPEDGHWRTVTPSSCKSL